MATTMKGTFAELTAAADTVGAAGEQLWIQAIHFTGGTGAATMTLTDGDGDTFASLDAAANADSDVFFPHGLRVKAPVTLATLGGTAAGPVYIYFR